MRETRPRGHTAVVCWSVGKQTLFRGSAFAALFFSLRGLSALSTVLSTLPGHSERAALVFRPASRPPAVLTPPLSVAVYLRLYSSVSVALVPSLRFSRLSRGTLSERPSCFVRRAARPQFSHLHFSHLRLSPPSLHPPPHTPATSMATPDAPDTPDGLFTPEQLSWLQARLPLPASDALPGPSTASAPFPPAPTTPASGECGMGVSERTALACTVVKVRNFTRSLVHAIPAPQLAHRARGRIRRACLPRARFSGRKRYCFKLLRQSCIYPLQGRAGPAWERCPTPPSYPCSRHSPPPGGRYPASMFWQPPHSPSPVRRGHKPPQI